MHLWKFVCGGGVGEPVRKAGRPGWLLLLCESSSAHGGPGGAHKAGPARAQPAWEGWPAGRSSCRQEGGSEEAEVGRGMGLQWAPQSPVRPLTGFSTGHLSRPSKPPSPTQGPQEALGKPWE